MQMILNCHRPRRRFRLSILIPVAAIALCLISATRLAHAEADWMTFTMDNDYFVATDDGYTNGMFFSWYDTTLNNKPEPGFLSRAMLWSLPDDAGEPMLEIDANTVGQTMMTPSDIDVEDPPENELPYSGLLFYGNSYVRAYPGYADKISVVFGILGEYSFAEDTQKSVHKAIGADRPEGWDTQLDDEIVFQFGRSRAYRSWISDDGRSEVLTGVDASLGTISSSTGVAAMYRYGEGLQRTYSTALLAAERISNPIAVEGGWYWFAGARAGYLANWIFADGNTYKSSRSIDYKEEQLSLTAGFAYSWKNYSLTYAINDLNVLEDEDEDDLDELTQYGTFTFAWRGD